MSYLELPNEDKLWERGIALDWYTQGFDKEINKYIKTELGQAVREYKYYSQLKQVRRDSIVAKCVEAITKVLGLEKTEEKLTFNSCIGVAPNRKTGFSLPLEIARQLSVKFDWLHDSSDFIVKTKELESVRTVSGEKLRAEILKDGYAVRESDNRVRIHGFLIVDDVYETGATLKEICRTLERAFPNIPRYVLVVAQKKPVVVWKMS